MSKLEIFQTAIYVATVLIAPIVAVIVGQKLQSAMGLSRDKITVCVYKGYIGKGRKEPDPSRAG